MAYIKTNMEVKLACLAVPLCFLLCALSCHAQSYGQTGVFNSNYRMRETMHQESWLSDSLMTYIAQEEQRIQELKEIAADYASHSERVLNDPENYLANPVNSYLLIKRFTSDWQRVAEKIRNPAAEEFLNNITQSLLVSDNDLPGVARALLRLQDTYALDTAKLVKGEIDGAIMHQPLAADDIYEVGVMAYVDGDYYHAILWLEQALALQEEQGEDIATRARTLDYLAFALYQQGNIEAALNRTKEWIQLDCLEDPTRAYANMDHYERMMAEGVETEPHKLKNPRIGSAYRTSTEFAEYEALCRGESTKKIPFSEELKCYHKRDHPLFYLAPLKFEVNHVDPMITTYHNLITDAEIEKVKELAKPELHTSGMFTPVDGSPIPLDTRVSSSAWLSDAAHPLLQQLSNKVSAALGLSIIEAEDMQVLNYGIGGHYECHHDFNKDTESVNDLPDFVRWGNRISTSLYYMSDVKVGGSTVFPQLGIGVKPEKGMMVSWFNLFKSGKGDYRTLHAGCPVLVGEKWVCNKWIHERGQEFRRPCSLNPLE